MNSNLKRILLLIAMSALMCSYPVFAEIPVANNSSGFTSNVPKDTINEITNCFAGVGTDKWKKASEQEQLFSMMFPAIQLVAKLDNDGDLAQIAKQYLNLKNRKGNDIACESIRNDKKNIK